MNTTHHIRHAVCDPDTPKFDRFCLLFPLLAAAYFLIRSYLSIQYGL